MIELTCPTCSNKMIVKDEHAGKSGKCKRCDSLVKIPSTDDSFAPIEDDYNDMVSTAIKARPKPAAQPQVVYLKAEKGAGTTGNVLAAIMSFVFPGLGQLVQGRAVIGIVMLILAALLWVFLFMGWIIHIWSIVDAAIWKPAE